MNPVNLSALNLSDPVGSLVGGITVRSAIAPPVELSSQDVSGLVAGSGSTQAHPSFLWGLVKPTLIVHSPVLGDRIVAPYGVAQADDWLGGEAWLGLGALVAGLAVFGLGYMVGSRR